MKNIIYILFFFSIVNAQNVKRSVEIDTFDIVYSLNGGETFEISYNGIKFPLILQTTKANLTPDTSQMIFCSDCVAGGEFQYWNGAEWVGLAGTFNGAITFPNEIEISINGTVDDLDIGSSTNTLFLTDTPNSGALTITGFLNSGSNKEFIIFNQKGSNVTIRNNNVNSSVGNRVIGKGSSVVIAPNESIRLRWSLLNNAWIVTGITN